MTRLACMEGITVLFDCGSGNNRKLINLTEFGQAYREEYHAALLGLHAVCGCYSTSAFIRKGHGKPLKQSTILISNLTED